MWGNTLSPLARFPVLAHASLNLTSASGDLQNFISINVVIAYSLCSTLHTEPMLLIALAHASTHTYQQEDDQDTWRYQDKGSRTMTCTSTCALTHTHTHTHSSTHMLLLAYLSQRHIFLQSKSRSDTPVHGAHGLQGLQALQHILPIAD